MFLGLGYPSANVGHSDLIRGSNRKESILKEVPITEATVYLKMIGDGINNHFYNIAVMAKEIFQ